MITIDLERCTGCGACLEVCPSGALYLVDGRATVDGVLCCDCQACIAACPTEAILTAEEATMPAAEPVRVPVLRPEPELVLVQTHPDVPLRAKVLPLVGAALTWTAREIVPHLAACWLDGLDRRGTEKRVAGTGQYTSDNRSHVRGRDRGGRRRRRRRRGNQRNHLSGRDTPGRSRSQ